MQVPMWYYHNESWQVLEGRGANGTLKQGQTAGSHRPARAWRRFVSREPKQPASIEGEVDKAMALLDDLDRLAVVAGGAELTQLIDTLNVMIWLRFTKIRPNKRVLNKRDYGLMTVGDAPWPIEPYSGSRNGSANISETAKNENDREASSSRSLQKAGRGDCTRFERREESDLLTIALLEGASCGHKHRPDRLILSV